jgi:hypothetical protein
MSASRTFGTMPNAGALMPAAVGSVALSAATMARASSYVATASSGRDGGAKTVFARAPSSDRACLSHEFVLQLVGG